MGVVGFGADVFGVVVPPASALALKELMRVLGTANARAVGSKASKTRPLIRCVDFGEADVKPKMMCESMDGQAAWPPR